MTDIAVGLPAHDGRPSGTRFPAQHPWDRNFFLGLVALIWLGILMGFVPQMVQHVARHETPYPLIVHMHAVAFVGWLLLLTAQVLLVRTRNIKLHRNLGYGMAALGVAMVLLGLAAAWAIQQRDFGTPRSNPGFLAVQFSDMLTFALVGGAGILLRNSPSAHKRLMIIATLVIADAGFVRWVGGSVTEMLGRGMWQRYIGLSGISDLTIVGIGVYDLITRRRLHPAYIAGAAWAVGWQMLSACLQFNSEWKEIATQLLGR